MLPRLILKLTAICLLIIQVAVNAAEETALADGDSPRKMNSTSFGPDFTGGFRFGLHLDGTKLFASVPYSADGSGGLGYGIGLEARFYLIKNWHLTVVSSYQHLELGRTVDASGVITDPSPVTFSQSVDYLGLTLLVGFRALSQGGVPLPLSAVEWWLDGGFQILLPLYGRQTSSLGEDRAFSPKDRPLLLVVGPSVSYMLAGNFGVLGAFRAFYNLGSQSGSHLYGARFELSVSFGV